MSASVLTLRVASTDGVPSWEREFEPGAVHIVEVPAGWGGQLVRLAVGLPARLDGRATLLGSDLAALPRRERLGAVREVGVLPQPDGLVSNLTVRDNVRLPLHFGRPAPHGAEEETDTALRLCELEGIAGVRPTDLTLDLRERAALGRAICGRPRVLLLGEPLETHPRRGAVRLLAGCLARTGTTIVFAADPERFAGLDTMHHSTEIRHHALGTR